MADDAGDLMQLIEAPYKKPKQETRDASVEGNGTPDGQDKDKDTKASKRKRSRSRGERESSRRSENGHRSSRRSRSRSRDKDKDREKSLHHSSSRRSERSEKGDRDRDRERERDRDRDRERERERSSRGGDGHSRDDHSRRRSRDRDHDRSRRGASRDRDRDRDRDSERKRNDYGDRPARPRRPPSPILSDEERDKRTVFCMQLAARLKEQELFAFFEQAGPVRDARIITDRISGRSKGVGYVEFYEEATVPVAIALTGQKLLGIPIAVTITEAEKNRQAEAEKAAQAAYGMGKGSEPGSRVYVGNIHINLSETDVRQVFDPFGPVENVSLHPAVEGRSGGYAFVQYRSSEDARKAVQQMNGFELGGRQLKVSYVTSEKGQMSNMAPSSQSLSIDEGETNFAMNAQTRAELMKKLAARSSSDLFPTQKSKQAETPPPPAKTTAIKLTNMFSPEEETEPDWDVEIGEDVRSEAEKYGRVSKLRVDKDSQGHVYIAFDSIESAERAIAALNGRLFAGNKVVASFVPENAV